MAILSCCQNAVAAKPLAQQTFRRFTKLDIDGCATLMQVLGFSKHGQVGGMIIDTHLFHF